MKWWSFCCLSVSIPTKLTFSPAEVRESIDYHSELIGQEENTALYCSTSLFNQLWPNPVLRKTCWKKNTDIIYEQDFWRWRLFVDGCADRKMQLTKRNFNTTKLKFSVSSCRSCKQPTMTFPTSNLVVDILYITAE